MVMKMLQEAMKQSSKGTVAAYKENIRQYLTVQFDEIIEDARKEIEESGEGVGTALADLQQLKQTKYAQMEFLAPAVKLLHLERKFQWIQTIYSA